MNKHQENNCREAQVLVDVIRKQCQHKGLIGIKGLSVLFRKLDKDYSKSVCFREFGEGLRGLGIVMTDSELMTVFDSFDTNRSGQVDFCEFLRTLKPKMNKRRMDLVMKAFYKLDTVADGVLKVEDLKDIYADNARKHPKYQAGIWTLEEVLQSFLDNFDDPDNKDGVVSVDDFIKYYENVSCTIDDDAYFELMMVHCWGLKDKDQKPSQSKKQSKASSKGFR